MDILILEDDINRIEAFKKKLHTHTVTCTDQVEVAKTLLKEKKFDIIFLDHDLDGKIYVDSNEPNTGYQLAKYIHENDIHFLQIIIHTMNGYGGDAMYDELKNQAPELYRIPFNQLINNILV